MVEHQPMSEPLPNLLMLARDTVSDPREGARRVLAMGLPEGVLWQALVLAVALSVLLTELGQALGPSRVDPMVAVFLQNPLPAAIIQGGLLVVMVYAIHFIARGFGGTGDFAGALALVVWLQFIMVCLQVVQTVFLVVMPPVSALIGLFGIGLFFWLLSHFVAVLNGFPSVLKTFFGIVVSMIGIVVGLNLLLLILGLSLGGALPDV